MKQTFVLTIVGIVIISVIGLHACGENKDESYQGRDYLSFPDAISHVTPYDVDIDLEKRLVKENKIDEAQRLFDILSWQMFISLNWPRDSSGEPMPNIADAGRTEWEDWKESFQIFKEDGSAPAAWGALDERPRFFKNIPPTTKVLYRASKAEAFNQRHETQDTIDEINQAFTAPIWDQNGNILRYEIRMNKVITDYIVKHELYNLDGQIAFSNALNKVDFPKSTRTKPGVIEIKAAWKIIDPKNDLADRYYSIDAAVIDSTGSFSIKKVGLVGMHISTRSESSPQWIWATFEHVDNLETNPLELHNGKNIHPAFYDPSCATCPVNLLPDKNRTPLKNQIQRVLPIPKATEALNKVVQAKLKSKGSVWQYYQLIGTQWPTDPAAKPYFTPTNTASGSSDTSVYTLPQSVENKSGGKPAPVYLTNMIMETYFQGGTITGDDPKYNEYLGNEPAYFQIQGFPKNIDVKNTNQIIFGTEGCMGCHFSSAIAVSDTVSRITGKRGPVFGNPGTANFDWLLQLKANFKKVK